MPRRAKRPCAVPGCPELVEHPARHCPAHAGEYDRRRGSSAQRGYGYRWRRLRAKFLREHPVCRDPDGRHPGRVIPATEVDHITPRSQGGGDEPSNLQALCKSCHSAKTARESGLVPSEGGRGD